MKVLIVDDSSLARRTLRQHLESLGCAVEEASSGEEALERYALGLPELVFLDMVMTGMYGMEVLAKMREINPEVPVIVSTADIQSSTAAEARRGGAKALLNKPVNRERLKAAIDKVTAGEDAWN
jgi:two-component system chemotaxis response regulator CheY